MMKVNCLFFMTLENAIKASENISDRTHLPPRYSRIKRTGTWFRHKKYGAYSGKAWGCMQVFGQGWMVHISGYYIKGKSSDREC